MRQINAFSDNKIYLDEQPALGLLKVKEDHWKWLLYQFLIHKNLTKSKLKAMFGSESAEIAAFLPELQKADILEEIKKNTYTLNKVVKPNIENWLADSNILN